MSTSSSHRSESSRDVWAGGVSIFAGTVLLTLGLLQFFEGLSAVLDDDVYLSTKDYVYQFDLSTWGWIHLVIGVLAVVVGASILAGQAWAIGVGLGLAGLSVIANFMFLPDYPLWALVIIAIDVAVIWALSVRLGNG